MLALLNRSFQTLYPWLKPTVNEAEIIATPTYPGFNVMNNKEPVLTVSASTAEIRDALGRDISSHLKVKTLESLSTMTMATGVLTLTAVLQYSPHWKAEAFGALSVIAATQMLPMVKSLLDLLARVTIPVVRYGSKRTILRQWLYQGSAYHKTETHAYTAAAANLLEVVRPNGGSSILPAPDSLKFVRPNGGSSILSALDLLEFVRPNWWC